MKMGKACDPAEGFRAVPQPLLEPVRSALLERLAQTPMERPAIDVYSNVTAQPVREPDDIRRSLGEQVCSPVLWEQTISNMSSAGIDTFVEFDLAARCRALSSA